MAYVALQWGEYSGGTFLSTYVIDAAGAISPDSLDTDFSGKLLVGAEGNRFLVNNVEGASWTTDFKVFTPALDSVDVLAGSLAVSASGVMAVLGWSSGAWHVFVSSDTGGTWSMAPVDPPALSSGGVILFKFVGDRLWVGYWGARFISSGTYRAAFFTDDFVTWGAAEIPSVYGSYAPPGGGFNGPVVYDVAQDSTGRYVFAPLDNAGALVWCNADNTDRGVVTLSVDGRPGVLFTQPLRATLVSFSDTTTAYVDTPGSGFLLEGEFSATPRTESSDIASNVRSRVDGKEYFFTKYGPDIAILDSASGSVSLMGLPPDVSDGRISKTFAVASGFGPVVVPPPPFWTSFVNTWEVP